MKSKLDEFDFSDNPKGRKGNFLHSDTNKKVVNKFKDELHEEIAY